MRCNDLQCSESDLISATDSVFDQFENLITTSRCVPSSSSSFKIERMPATATIVGALLGLSTQMYSNALRKLPYMRHPWEHLLGMGVGAVFVNQLVKWDAHLQEDLDKMLQKAKESNERRYIDTDDNY